MPKHYIIFPILGAFQNKKVRPYYWRCHMLWRQNLPPFVCGSFMCLCEHILHMEGRGQSVRVSFLNLLCGFWDSKPGPQVWPQGHTSSPNLVLYYFNSGWFFWFCKCILVFLHLNLKCPNTQSTWGSVQDKDAFCLLNNKQ